MNLSDAPKRYVAFLKDSDEMVETGPIEGARYYILRDPDVEGGVLCLLAGPKREEDPFTPTFGSQFTTGDLYPRDAGPGLAP